MARLPSHEVSEPAVRVLTRGGCVTCGSVKPPGGCAPVAWRSRQRPHPATGRKEHRHDRPHGGRHLPREAPGDRVPIVRDLRRAPLVLGLRSARGRDPPQHPQRLVALDGPAARRDRGPGGGDHHVAQGVGGVRPRRRLLRSARRVRELPSPVPRGPPAGAAGLSELRRDGVRRVEALQPDVQDAHGAGGGRLRRDVSASRDRAGHVRRLPAGPDGRRARSCRSGSPRSASRSATRSRRATSSSVRASSSRWRWSTSWSPAPTTSGSTTG